MQTHALALFVGLLVAISPHGAGTQEKPASPIVQLVGFDTAASIERLHRSNHKADFFRLANQFEPQMNIGTCGPTTAVIVLNALRSPGDARRPVDATAFPAPMRTGLPAGMQPVEPRYTQRAFFDNHFTKVKPVARFYGKPDDVGTRDPGVQLRQLHDMLALHDLDVTIRIVADDLPATTVRKELIANLGRAGDYVIVNYTRKELGQRGGGHISPVAAYDEKSDSFLVMDVNPNRAPWVWVAADDLIRAMRTKDTNENRGYLLVRDQQVRSTTLDVD